MTSWTRDDVVAAVKRSFPDEDPDVVLAVLDECGSGAYDRNRVRLAVIELSQGDVDKLLYYTDLARKDFRDVLWWPDGPVIPLEKQEGS